MLKGLTGTLRHSTLASLESECPKSDSMKTNGVCAGLVQQTLADGGAQIAATHSTASRYGRITFSTRLTFANLDRAW